MRSKAISFINYSMYICQIGRSSSWCGSLVIWGSTETRWPTIMQRESRHLAVNTDIRRDPESSVSDIKFRISLLWWEGWPSLNFSTISPAVGPWEMQLPRFIDIRLTRLRLNCTKITHLIPYIENSFPPMCTNCNRRVTVKHLLLYCANYQVGRQPIISYCIAMNPFTTN